VTKAILILIAIGLGACVPQLTWALPALPWIIGVLLLIGFCGLPRGASRPTRVHLWLVVASWLIGGLACAALWPVDHALALGALLTGAAPTATAAPVVVAALGGHGGFAAVAVLGSNLVACCLFPVLLAVLQGPDAPGSPWQLVLRVAPVVLAPWLVARLLVRLRPVWAAAVAAQMGRSFLLWLVGLSVISASAASYLRLAGLHALLPHAATAGVLCVLSFVIGNRLGGARALEAGQSLGQKNTALATWTALACAGAPAALVPASYILAHNLWNAVQLARRSGAPRAAD
jgi:BASS family bile acid:Na+ symporter